MRRRVPAGFHASSLRLRAALLTAAVALAAPALAQEERQAPAPTDARNPQLPKMGAETADRVREELRAKKIPLRGETSYVPVAEPVDFNALVRKLQRELGVTSIVVTHDIRAGFRIANRVALLRDGAISFEGSPEEMVTANDQYIQAFLS